MIFHESVILFSLTFPRLEIDDFSQICDFIFPDFPRLEIINYFSQICDFQGGVGRGEGLLWGGLFPDLQEP